MQNFCIKPNLYPSKVSENLQIQCWSKLMWALKDWNIFWNIPSVGKNRTMFLFEIRSNKNFLIRGSPVPYFGLCTLTKLLFQRSLNLEGVVKITSINGAYLRVCSNCWRLRIKIYKRVSKFMKSQLNLYSTPN